MEKRTLVAVALVVVATAPVATGAAAADAPEPGLTVAVHENGSATLRIRMTFDLTSPAERAAFESLANNRSARERMLARFRDRMASVVATTENVTGREMAIEDVGIELVTTDGGSVGVVRLSVTWIGLAAQEGDRLIVRQPFASDFDPERRVVLRAPEGYAIERATPDPESRTATRAVWSAETSLSGFEVVLEPTAATASERTGATGTSQGTSADSSSGESASKSTTNPDRTTATGGQPGFGAVVAVAALFVLARFRRWSE